MIRIILLLGFFLYFQTSFAEVITVEGTYRHAGDMSPNDGCKMAQQRAELKAREKVGGKTISLEEMELCSEIEGKSNCERNRIFFSQFSADITKLDVSDPKKSVEGDIYICTVQITADVTPIKQISDPNFNFNVNFNDYTFKDGEELKIEISLSTPMYLNIFQVLPYRDPKDYQVIKLFPNEIEKNSYIKAAKINLPKGAKYEIYFPDNVNKRSVDEDLVFISSKEKLNFLNKFTTKEDFKNSYIKSSNKMKIIRKTYRVVK